MSISCVWRAFSLFLRHQTINTRDKFQAAKGWINFTHTCWKKWVAIARSDTSWQTLSHCRKSAPHQIRHIRSVCRHPHPAQQIPRPLLESFSPGPVVTRLLEPAPLLLSDHELQQLFQKVQSYLLQEEPQTCQHSSFKAFPFSSFSTLTSSCGQPHDAGFNFSSASLESFFLTTLLDYVSHSDRTASSSLIRRNTERNPQTLPPSPQQGTQFTFIEPIIDKSF